MFSCTDNQMYLGNMIRSTVYLCSVNREFAKAAAWDCHQKQQPDAKLFLPFPLTHKPTCSMLYLSLLQCQQLRIGEQVRKWA